MVVIGMPFFGTGDRPGPAADARDRRGRADGVRGSLGGRGGSGRPRACHPKCRRAHRRSGRAHDSSCVPGTAHTAALPPVPGWTRADARSPSGEKNSAVVPVQRQAPWCCQFQSAGDGVVRRCGEVMHPFGCPGARVPGCPGVRAVGAPTEAETWCARRSLDATHTTAPAVDASGSPQRISGRSGAGGSRREGHAGAPTPGLEFGGKATSSRRGGRSTLLGFASASLGTGVRGTETWSHDSDTMVGFSRPEAYSFPVTPAELVESLPAWVTRGREEKDDLGSDLAVEIGWQTGHEVGS